MRCSTWTCRRSAALKAVSVSLLWRGLSAPEAQGPSLTRLACSLHRIHNPGVTWAIFASGVAKYVELEQPHVCATKRTTGQAPSTLFLNLMREAEKSSRITGECPTPARRRA